VVALLEAYYKTDIRSGCETFEVQLPLPGLKEQQRNKFVCPVCSISLSLRCLLLGPAS